MRALGKRLGMSFLLVFVACSHAQSLDREVRQKILEAVVQIVPLDSATGQLADWSGSGTIISPRGYILTNFHVIGDADTRDYFEWHAIFVTSARAPDEPPRHRYWARYVASDAAHDLAILKIVEYADETPVPDSLTFTAMPVGDSNTLLPGDTLTVVGYPGISGATITFTSGLMSGWLGEDLNSGGKQWIKTDAKIARGNSGGAAFDQNGTLIGVPTAGSHLLEGSLYEEQLYVRPIGLAWSLIGPNVPDVVVARAPSSQGSAPLTPPSNPLAPAVPESQTSAEVRASGSYGAIAVGGTVSSTIAAKGEGEAVVYNTYTVNVPPGTAQLTIALDGGDRDLDLAVNAGEEIQNYNEADHLDTSAETRPTYTYNDPPAGTVYIDVLNLLGEDAPYSLTVSATAASTLPELTAGTTASTTVGALQLGQSASGRLASGGEGSSGYHTYTVDVPAGTPQLTITMTADLDLDLAVKYGAEITSYRDLTQGGNWDYRDNSTETDATLVIDNPQPGRWYIDVFNALGQDATGAYSLTVR